MEKLTFEIHDNGDQFYLNKDNQLHNPVGPAAIWSDGYKEYLLNGKLHNENGPAIIRSDGTEYYYLNDKRLSKEKWEQQVKKVK